jgi:hypothetical protein
MGWLTQIPRAPGAIGRLRRMADGGGPRRLRVRGLDRPTGLIVPSSRLKLEFEMRNGSKARWEPEIPIPFPYAWGYRLSRRLGVPVISSHDPENLAFSIPLPRLRGKARG